MVKKNDLIASRRNWQADQSSVLAANQLCYVLLSTYDTIYTPKLPCQIQRFTRGRLCITRLTRSKSLMSIFIYEGEIANISWFSGVIIFVSQTATVHCAVSTLHHYLVLTFRVLNYSIYVFLINLIPES